MVSAFNVCGGGRPGVNILDSPGESATPCLKYLVSVDNISGRHCVGWIHCVGKWHILENVGDTWRLMTKVIDTRC